MSRGMSRGGSFPIIIAVLGTLIVAVIAIFVYLQFAGGSDRAVDSNNGSLPTPTLMATPTPGATPTPTPMPTPEVTPPPVEVAEDAGEVTPSPTPTQQITPKPIYSIATIQANALNVRSGPDSSYPKIGKVSYGTVCQVFDEDGSWLQIEYNGGYGWVFDGTTGDGTDSVARGSEPLKPAPTAPKVSLVSSWGTVNGTNTSFSTTISFSSGVYSDEACTGAIQASDFSVTGGSITKIENNAPGTQSVTLTYSVTSSTALKVTINKNSVFSPDKVDGGSYKSYTVPGAPEKEGTGKITGSNCSVQSGDAYISSATQANAGDKEVTVVCAASKTLSAGTEIKVKVSGYNKSADAISAYTVYTLPSDVNKDATFTCTVTAGEGIYRTTAEK